MMSLVSSGRPQRLQSMQPISISPSSRSAISDDCSRDRPDSSSFLISPYQKRTGDEPVNCLATAPCLWCGKSHIENPRGALHSPHRPSERSLAMTNSLANATIALVFSAILGLAPAVATADYSGKTPGRCGVVPCTGQQQVQQKPSPIPSMSYRGLR